MQIICISRGTFRRGKELAEKLAQKLDYECLSWEDLSGEATRRGIQVGKLEMSMVNSGVFSGKLALEKEHFLAFATSYMCTRLTESKGLIYHGRIGHLKLPGISHILRVRVLADHEQRIQIVMQEKGLDRQKASRYIREVDEDRRRWVYSMYGVSLEDPANYDVMINLGNINRENAAAALVNMAQLPDFQLTPADTKALKNLDLAARVRLALAEDERTFAASLKVRAENGTATVTYLPQDSEMAGFIPTVCSGIEGLQQINTTMAMTNILWIQEDFQPHSEIYEQVVEIATKWNAAVELIRLAPEDESPSEHESSIVEAAAGDINPDHSEYNGGIEEEPDFSEEDKGNLKKTLNELAREGRSGGGRFVYGGQSQLINAIDPSTPYTLVVIGEIFKSSGHAAMLRSTRDLRNFLGERIKAPVVTADEIGSQYLFGKKDITKAGICLAATLFFFMVVFTNQEPILAFLSQTGWYEEALKDSFLGSSDWGPGLVVSAAVFIMVPIVAFCYGTVASSILKLIKME
ncbi:MAG: AAA family ATPase [Desulfobacterales bacterium]